MDEHATECASSVAALRAAVDDAAMALQARWGAEGEEIGEELPLPGAEQRGGAAASGTSSVDAHFAAVRDLTLMHACELWALRLFGPRELESELRILQRTLAAEG